MTFALFALLPFGLLSWFSRRELANTRATAGIWPLLIGVGTSLASKYFKKKAADKQGKAQVGAQVGAAELKNQMNEDTRGASLQAAASLLGKAGSDFALDPALVQKLGVRRNYDFKKGIADPTAGSGSSFLSGLFDTATDLAGQYGANQQNGDLMEKLQGLTKTAGSDVKPFDPKITADFGPKPNCPPGTIC